jgi:hypothetical protein
VDTAYLRILPVKQTIHATITGYYFSAGDLKYSEITDLFFLNHHYLYLGNQQIAELTQLHSIGDLCFAPLQ